MKLHDIPRKIVPYSFIILSLASTAYIAASTINYLGFWPAVNQITWSISRVTLVQTGASNTASLQVWVTISNPSDYSGFKVAVLSLSTYFLPSNTSQAPLFQETPQKGGGAYSVPLPPHAETSINVTTVLVPTDAASLSNYLIPNHDSVTAHCSLAGEISTFLDPAIGFFPITQQPAQELPLSLAS